MLSKVQLSNNQLQEKAPVRQPVEGLFLLWWVQYTRFQNFSMSSSVHTNSAIIKTLAYFDGANFPLTTEELFRYLWQSPSIDRTNVSAALAELVAWGVVATKWGYYFLPGREATIERRRRATVFSDQKLKRARRAAKFIKAVPFLRAVLVANSVGRGVAEAGSDIDFFIIAEKGRIWIVRFFTNLILRMFGLRTYGTKRTDRVCLCFYIDAVHLDLANYRALPEDIHFAYWLQQMAPVYDPDKWYERFLKANHWAAALVPHQKTRTIAPEMRLGWLGKMWRGFFEIAWRGVYGSLIEKQAKDIQMMKIKPAVKAKALQKDNGVVLGEGIIKLHEQDTRLVSHEAWVRRVAELEKIQPVTQALL